jgi:ferric-dicitrate binding protein FerR (iron transport regulator)
MNKELLEKYCNNRCTEEELKYILHWFEVSARKPEGKQILFEVWDKPSDNECDIDYDLLLDKLHHEVNLTQSRTLLKKADENLIKYRIRERILKYFARAAAILIIPVLGFTLYLSSRYVTLKHDQLIAGKVSNEVISSVDAITKVTLPDGTKVWLNHSSSLKYPAVYLENRRDVELIGEGYFEVAHNPEKPFFVTAGEIEIKALGTEFNIMAYPDEDRIETSLINGSIELHGSNLTGNSVPLVRMKPSDLAIFQKSSKELSVLSIPDDRYFAWKLGKLVFNEEPMDKVAEKLSRWFNVEVEIKDTELLELTYTATFINETLPQVMELIAIASPVSYSISKREEIRPGTFSKQKVTLRSRAKR